MKYKSDVPNRSLSLPLFPARRINQCMGGGGRRARSPLHRYPLGGCSLTWIVSPSQRTERSTSQSEDSDRLSGRCTLGHGLALLCLLPLAYMSTVCGLSESWVAHWLSGFDPRDIDLHSPSAWSPFCDAFKVSLSATRIWHRLFDWTNGLAVFKGLRVSTDQALLFMAR